MATNVTATIEFELSGVGAGWTSIPDVRMGPYNVDFTFGINGTGPEACVADPGTLRFVLDNSNKNSGSTLGWYSLNHGSKRAGFALGIRVRYTLTSGGTARYKFIGTLDAADPIPNTKGERVVLCSAVDWMDEDVPGRNGSPSLPAQVMRRAGNDGSPQEPRPRLNPDFVEALMGFPRGWTAYAALEMESCRPKRLGPSESCVSA